MNLRTGPMPPAGGIRCLAFMAVATLSLAMPGCRTGAGSVQKTVERKSAEQQHAADGTERWEQYRQNEYQSTNSIARDRAAIGRERDRATVARSLITAGPLSLETCLAYSLEFNDRVQAARASIRAAGGDAVMNRSRFLPHVTYRLRTDQVEPDAGTSTNATFRTNVTHQAVRVSQTLLEFGRDNPADVALRESQRQALFAYEDSVRDMLSEVRKKFFTVLLREQQLAERRKTLTEFQARHEQIRQLEESRRVLEVDVLTARLNMLNEEARINLLEREILRKKADLLHGVGFPVGMTDMTLQGSPEEFSLPIEQAVTLALTRSSAIAEARAAVEEQARQLRETRWDYTPDTTLELGWKSEQTAAGLNMGSADGLYTVSAFAEEHSDDPTGYLQEDFSALGRDEGWFMTLALELPVFEGLEIRGRALKARALLEQARHALRNATDEIELQVLQSTQTMLERRKEVDILRETVSISRERLRVQERLKELGKISDNDLENFRNQYFRDQDQLFTQQISLVEAQEDIRRIMRYFDPLPAVTENVP